MRIQLYRGYEPYIEVDTPPGVWLQWNIRHSKPFSVVFMDIDTFDINACDAIETFELRDGVYQSVNFKSLPSWVIRQEMEQREEADRERRFESFCRMMEGVR